MIFWYLALTSIFISLYPPGADGGTKHWEFAGWYGGGCYPNVEFDPSVKGRVYLGSDVAGAWRSDDLGETWRFVTNGLSNLTVSFMAVSPSNSNVLYSGTQEGLFVSQDAGQTWQPCNRNNGEIRFIRPQNYRSVAILPPNPASVCVGTASGSIFYSENFGQTWQILGNLKQPFGDDKPITAISFGANGNTIYTSSDKGLAKYSFDTGKWNQVSMGPTQVTDFVLAKGTPETLYVAGQSRLFISTDGGNTWSQSTPAVSAGRINRISVAGSTDGTFIAVAWQKDWNGGILLSRDRGKTWTSADSNMAPDLSNPTRAWAGPTGPVTALKINPFDQKVLFRTDWWGVWRSDDGGASWKEKIQGAPNVAGSDVHVSAQGYIYVASMDNGLTVSSDGGKSYRPLFPAQGYRPDVNGHVWRVLTFGEKDETIIATSSPWGQDINQIILSADGGRNFELIRNGLPSRRPKVNTLWGQGYPRALAADPLNTNNLYLGIDGDDGGGLYVSRDRGRSWAYAKGQPGSRKIYNALAVDPLHPTHLYWGACGANGGVYLSKDGGSSWQRVFSEMTWVFDLRIAKNGVIYIAGDNRGPCLYASYNGGNSWKLMKRFPGQGTAEGIYVDPDNPNRIGLSSVQWGGHSGGKIYWSENGGASWEDISGDLPAGTGAAAIAFSKRSKALYIARYAGSVYKRDISVPGPPQSFKIGP
jgi:photosystem II stability/assembly factor-like uncharacterized protein